MTNELKLLFVIWLVLSVSILAQHCFLDYIIIKYLSAITKNLTNQESIALKRFKILKDMVRSILEKKRNREKPFNSSMVCERTIRTNMWRECRIFGKLFQLTQYLKCV